MNKSIVTYFRDFIGNKNVLPFLTNIASNYLSGDSSNKDMTNVLYGLLIVQYYQSKDQFELDLNSLELISFDANSSVFKDIQKSMLRVNLCGNNLVKCPHFGGDWKMLTKLDLSNNNFGAVEKDLFTLPAIRELKLGHNNLKMLPRDLTFSPTLMVLALNNNQLTSLPKELEKSSINNINLKQNKFENVPQCLCNMKWLKILDLSFNKNILEFPLEFGKLSLEIMLILNGMQRNVSATV